MLQQTTQALNADIPYGSNPGQFGRLRLPAESGTYPLLIVVHGGYWRARHGLDYMDPVCAALAEAGYATWNIEYRRLGNGGGWPATFLDVGRATDALRGQGLARAVQQAHGAAGIRLSGQTIALGHSAGGHLALWLAARSRLSQGTPIYAPDPCPIHGVIALAGVSSLALAAEWDLSDGAAVSLLGGTPEEVPDRYQQASPDELLPLDVPQVLLHGVDDEDVPFAMSERYVERASAAGDDIELVRLPGGHFEPVDPSTEQWRQVLEAVQRLALR